MSGRRPPRPYFFSGAAALGACLALLSALFFALAASCCFLSLFFDFGDLSPTASLSLTAGPVVRRAYTLQENGPSSASYAAERPIRASCATTRPVTSPADETLTRLLRAYYWYGRPVLLLVYGAALLKGRALVHPLDIVMIALLWCFPFWVRLRLVPGVRKRQPELGVALQNALEQVDAQRAASKLPWVRARP